MTYEQLKPFYPKDMGRIKGYCLQNVAKGFHIYPSPKPSASAKADLEFNRKKGTLHSVNDLPSNCAVPVYQDTASKYEHIMVYDKGTWYSDGRKIGTPDYKTIFGWGEWCNGYQIVKKTSTRTFLPKKGYWGPGDQDERVAYLARFMRRTFPSYTSAKALGPLYGTHLTKAITTFQKRTGLYPDGYTGPKTVAKLKEYGFYY